MASAALQQLTERNASLELKAKEERKKAKATMQTFVGFAAAVGSAGVAGYVDKRFELSNDDNPDDGVTVLGMPVVPLLAIGVAAGGLAMGGTGGNILTFTGLGMGCGKAYAAGARKGAKAAEKAAAGG